MCRFAILLFYFVKLLNFPVKVINFKKNSETFLFSASYKAGGNEFTGAFLSPANLISNIMYRDMGSNDLMGVLLEFE